MPTSIDTHRRGSPRVAASEFTGDNHPAIWLDCEYQGRAFPIVGTEPAYLRPEVISGAFHVKRFLADSRGEFGAVLSRGDRRWAVYDLDRLDLE